MYVSLQSTELQLLYCVRKLVTMTSLESKLYRCGQSFLRWWLDYEAMPSATNLSHIVKRTWRRRFVVIECILAF